MNKAIKLTNTPQKAMPGPKVAKAKAGRKQKATGNPAGHKTGGLRGSSKPKPPRAA